MCWGTSGIFRKKWWSNPEEDCRCRSCGKFWVVGILSVEVEIKTLIWTIGDSSFLLGPLCTVLRR